MIKVVENYNIKNESTFKIGGIAKKVAFPSEINDLITLLSNENYDYVLGSCSNVLFSSGNINKNIIITKELKNYKFNGNKIYVECGVKGPLLAKECLKRGLTGFEFLIGFPGSFGGMLCMNASAHNQSISDSFLNARIFDKKNKKIINLNKQEMEFNYRNSRLINENYIVLDAEFVLKEDDTIKINELMTRNIKFRQERQPSLTYGNAGSIFKNPENDSAGRLLDLCNLKGEKYGGAVVYEKHANFILNINNATSGDVLNLMFKMRNNVFEKYGIKLQPEIKYIGDKESEEYKLWKTIAENT